MAFFNFIETFFFISLGITFVLVLLLVYHFKQRVSGLEHKCDTMFEIINDMVKQLNTIRIQNNVPFMNVFNPLSKTIPEIQHFINENIDITGNKYNNVIEEDEDDDEDEDDNDNEEDADDDDDNADDEYADEDDDNDNDEDVDDEDDNEEDADDEDDDDDDNDNDEGSIKIINVNITESNEITELAIEELTDNNENDINELETVESVNVEPINVEKIIPLDQEENVESERDIINKKESEKEVYKKMSMTSLKTLVISKGLCSDASKLKKHDLLKLLENIEE
jgi:hypothetical protein